MHTLLKDYINTCGRVPQVFFYIENREGYAVGNIGSAIQTAWCNFILNMVLAAAKILTGLLFGSAALLSDGAHSVADALSSVAVIVGVRMSRRGDDTQHPYGYERMECVAAVVLAMLIGTTGIGIGVAAGRMLWMSPASFTPPARYAWVTALAAIAVKEGMFRYTRAAARKTGSAALMADAWHQRTDALSSLGSLIGVVGAAMGFPLLDPIAGIAIALLILKAAIGIFADAMRRMVDHACDEAFAARLTAYAQGVTGVCEVVSLKTRLFGSRVLAEITVRVKEHLSAEEAYSIAVAVKEGAETTFETLKSCSVHIRPSEIALCDCKSPNDVL